MTNPTPASPSCKVHYDVVVFGGGLLGQAAAWAHSKKGKSVLLIEQGSEDNFREHSASQGIRRGLRMGPHQKDELVKLMLRTSELGEQLEKDFEEEVKALERGNKTGPEIKNRLQKVEHIQKNVLGHNIFLKHSPYLMWYPTKKAMQEGVMELKKHGILPEQTNDDVAKKDRSFPSNIPPKLQSAEDLSVRMGLGFLPKCVYTVKQARKKFGKNFPVGPNGEAETFVIDVAQPSKHLDHQKYPTNALSREMNIDRLLALMEWDFERHGGERIFNKFFHDYQYTEIPERKKRSAQLQDSEPKVKGTHHLGIGDYKDLHYSQKITCNQMVICTGKHTGKTLQWLVEANSSNRLNGITPMEVPERYFYGGAPGAPNNVITVPQLTLQVRFKKRGMANVGTTYFWNGGENHDDLGMYSFREPYKYVDPEHPDVPQLRIALKIGYDAMRGQKLSAKAMVKELDILQEHIEKLYGVEFGSPLSDKAEDVYTKFHTRPDGRVDVSATEEMDDGTVPAKPLYEGKDYDVVVNECSYPIDVAMSPSIGTINMSRDKTKNIPIDILGPAIGYGAMISLGAAETLVNGVTYPPDSKLNPNYKPTEEDKKNFKLYGADPKTDFPGPSKGEWPDLKGRTALDVYFGKNTTR